LTDIGFAARDVPTAGQLVMKSSVANPRPHDVSAVKDLLQAAST
jgi:hypothetical protein